MKKENKGVVYRIAIIGIILLGIICTSSNCRAAVNQQTTETEKVEVDDTVPIASTGKYKDMDYSFLKTFDYGSSVVSEKEFSTVNEMKEANLKEGKVVRTRGYYKASDGGAASYLVSSKQEIGGIELVNGLYANIQPDIYVDIEGTKWIIGNVRQFGAVGDGVQEDHKAINNAIASVGVIVNGKKENSNIRGLIYLPAGEYKIADQIGLNYSKLNFVGDGDKTVLFTDNDYRDEEGYTEFLFVCWGANDMFIGNFKLDAREQDLYHYMRQFVIVYSNNVYVYKVNMNIPQSTYGSYYFEDKQYSNFCCYTGNKNITVDACRMEQMSGTYRGANIGVLDIWAGGEENITIMNCDLYGNARDEQVGFFSKDDDNAHVKNVNFLNNTMHSVQLKYVDVIGNRTMCFTVAYTNSKNVENIRIAGNHFICEADSKFMTFGNVKNCVIEDNIIEIKCTYKTWSMVFDSANPDSENIKVRNNDFFITSDVNLGKGNFVSGNLTLENNRIFADETMQHGIMGTEVHGNEIICLKQVGVIGENTNLTGNKIYLYSGLGTLGTNRYNIAVYSAQDNKDYIFSNNEIYDYLKCTDLVVFRSLFKLAGNLNTLKIDGNAFYFPNTRYTSADSSVKNSYVDEIGVYHKNAIFRKCFGTYGKIMVSNNKFQSVEIPASEGIFTYSANEDVPLEANVNEEVCSSVQLTYKGDKVSCIAVSDDKVDLGVLTYVAKNVDENGNVLEEKEVTGKKIRWYTSSEKMANVTSDGVVTRKLYGEVHVYAVPLDGSGVFGECTIIFEKEKATQIDFKEDSISLQPGLKYYMEYTVMPKNSNQKLVWSSSDTNVVTVDYNGMVCAVGKGHAIITGSTIDGTNLKKTITVNVGTLTVKKISLEKEYYYYNASEIGTTKQLNVKSYVPENAENIGIGKWESSNEDVIKVDNNGMITILGGGKSAITLYSLDGRKCGTTYIYVQPPKLSNLQVISVTNDSAKLSWDLQKNTRSYYVYQWNQENSCWDKANDGKEITQGEVTITGLKENKQYKFSVRPIVMRWETGVIETYEGEDNIIELKTLSYTPVTSLRGSHNKIDLPMKYSAELTVNYGPNNANYNGLDILASFDDDTIASVETISKETGKRVFKIVPKKYGYTMMHIKANDGWGVKLEIPVGVMTNQRLDLNKTDVSASGDGVRIDFSAIENEMDYLSEGSMTGYMIIRTQSIVYTNIGYVDAKGLEKYTYMDTTAEPGKTYYYAVAPCYKYNDYYFVGNGDGRHEVKTMNDIQATSLSAMKNIYTVPVGESVKISAKIGPDNVSSRVLKWVVKDDEIAEENHVLNQEEQSNIISTEMVGKEIGATTISVCTTDSSELADNTTLIVLPNKVDKVKTKIEGSSVELAWEKIEKVSGYHIYRYNTTTKTWNLTGNTKQASYVDSSIERNGGYRYKVVAYYAHNGQVYEGIYSDEVSIVVTQIEENENSTDNSIEDNNQYKGEYAGNDQDNIPTKDEKNALNIKPYRGIYDGKIHNAVEVQGTKKNDVIQYSVDGENWSGESPKIRNVDDSKVVFISLTRSSKVYYYSVLAKILPMSLEQLEYQLSEKYIGWDGAPHYPTLNFKTDVFIPEFTVSYSGTGEELGLYIVSAKGYGNFSGEIFATYEVQLTKGQIYRVGDYKYKKLTGNKVSLVGCEDASVNKLLVKDTVMIAGVKCKVVQIGKRAFRTCKQLKSVNIGRNVVSIGSGAFENSNKLKIVIVKSKMLKSIGKNTWKGINSNAIFEVPKTSLKKYKKLFNKKTAFKRSMKVKGQ